MGDEVHISAVRSSFTYAELGGALLKPAPSDEDPYSALEKLLEKVPEEMAVEFRRVFGKISESVRMVTEAQANQLVPAVQSAEDSQAAAEVTQTPHTNTDNARPKRIQKFGDFDVEFRRGLHKTKDGHAKLEVIKRVAEETSRVEKTAYSNALRIFCAQTMVPILHCLKEHYNGDEDAFIRDWAPVKFQHKRFKQLCGTDIQCGLKHSH